MKFVATELSGVIVVEPDVYRDPRGFFLETYRADRWAEGGVDATFVQDNHSRSVRGTLRGLHAQLSRPQAKLVRVIQGSIVDVVVDVRRGSPTFRRWIAVEISADNFRQIYVPVGFAHGLCVTSDTAEVEYKCSDLYDPADELRLLWNDPEIGIRWPVEDPILSDKDRSALPLSAWMDRLPTWSGPGR
ncbi:dTDP-4-dehydrorhamnose 3,5-epimerase [bacterium]|nr:dTDP-4-dehydrorhamnose 3,5-epimerase [bacterium]